MLTFQYSLNVKSANQWLHFDIGIMHAHFSLVTQSFSINACIEDTVLKCAVIIMCLNNGISTLSVMAVLFPFDLIGCTYTSKTTKYFVHRQMDLKEVQVEDVFSSD